MFRRPAFTLIELLIVVGIIGILLALSLPAVQAAREAARRAQCQNNMKQLALAVHSYHDAQKKLPSLYTSPPNDGFTVSFGLDTYSWQTLILPHLEQQSLYNALTFDEHPTHASNQATIEQSVAEFNCPSTPRTSVVVRGLWHGRSQFDEARSAAPADYNGTAGSIEAGVASRQLICDPSVTRYYWEEFHTPGIFGEVVRGKMAWDPPTVRNVSFSEATDGLSQTVLLVERAGLPDQYFEGGEKLEPHDPPQYRTWGNVGLWAISGLESFNQVYRQTGKPLVNFDNMLGLYSFHPAGCHAALADGSIHFVNESVDTDVLLALISRAGNEAVDLSAIR